MAKKDFPFRNSNFKFGSNLVSFVIFIFINLIISIIISGKSIACKYVDKMVKDYENENTSKLCRVNYIYISIIVVIAVVLAVAMMRATSYPMSVTDKDKISVYDRLIDNRTENLNPIFWESQITWENTKYELKDAPTSNIIYKDKRVNAEIKYICTTDYWESQLKKIILKIPYDESIKKEIVQYYGDKHIVTSSKKSNDYYIIWLLDRHYVVLEKRRDLNEEDYLYIKIGISGIIIDGVRRIIGALPSTYFEKNEYEFGGYAYIKKDSSICLSFHNITLNEHIDRSLLKIKNNTNVLNFTKRDSLTYIAKIYGIVPENSRKILFNTELTFYKDTLVHINITTNDKNAELYKNLYIDKYKVENKFNGGTYIGEVEYRGGEHREHTTHYKWLFKGCYIELFEKIDEYKKGNRDYKQLQIEYVQTRLYKELQEKISLKMYENKIEEDRRKMLKEREDSMRIKDKRDKEKTLI